MIDIGVFVPYSRDSLRRRLLDYIESIGEVERSGFRNRIYTDKARYFLFSTNNTRDIRSEMAGLSFEEIWIHKDLIVIYSSVWDAIAPQFTMEHPDQTFIYIKSIIPQTADVHELRFMREYGASFNIEADRVKMPMCPIKKQPNFEL